MVSPPIGLRTGIPGGDYAHSRIEALYSVCAAGEAIEGFAQAIAYEQTVELPVALVRDPLVTERVVGKIEDIVAAGDGVHHVRISYSQALANNQLLSLLNLIYGNVSIYPGVRLETLSLPDAFLAHFQGPKYGIDGVRNRLGVFHRPLLATAIKPRGAMSDYVTSMVYQFALGGGDIIKDDQNLVDDFDAFRWRVRGCVDALHRAREETGRRCLYLPHLSAPYEEIERFLEFAYQTGVDGVLVCPLLLGLDTTRGLLADYPLIAMAHPALSGSYLVNQNQGIEHGVLLGTLFRLAGADISIFPNSGGRFSFSEDACASIAARLREPLGELRAILPCPAGGMQYDDLPTMANAFGLDAVLLVGGALHGHRERLSDGTKAFVECLESVFSRDEYETPDLAGEASWSSTLSLSRDILSRIDFNEDFNWSGRESSPYKDAKQASGEGLAFKGVRRVELVGKFGERTKCDLRYFEVMPGGFTSHEQHVHTHIIIGARGVGQLRIGDDERAIGVNDVAFIAPLAAHQLRNDLSEPFGFYCIVDHSRDRPFRIE